MNRILNSHFLCHFLLWLAWMMPACQPASAAITAPVFSGATTTALTRVGWTQDDDPSWEEAYQKLLRENQDLREKVAAGEMSRAEVIEWLKLRDALEEEAYQKLLRENQDLREKVAAGETSRAEVIEWLKQNRDALGEDRAGENWIERNEALFIILIQLAWIVPLVVIMTIVHIVVKRREQRRTEALGGAADEMGLVFHGEGDAAFHQSLPDFPLFQVGRKKRLTNLVLADTPELKMGLFDYCFTVGHGKQKKVRRLSVVVVQSADLHAPRCHLRPQIVFWDPIGALLGKQDINFADHPEFSKAFVLKSDTEEQARAFFDPGLLDFFSQHTNISFETREGAFLYFRQWKRVDPTVDAIQSALAEGYAVLGALQDRLERPG
ncbi:MAG: hypothetical protein MK108_07145 [Mariniblastus sp.]|nr:hypothetical protein [Mariniblastus sp.]